MAFYRRRGFWVALVGIAVAAGVAATAISFIAAFALPQHRSVRPAVTPADSGLAYDVVPLRAQDGTLLEGWWIRPRDGARRRDLATVILAHPADGEVRGAPTGKAGMLREASFLSRAGFLVLAFDFRSYGGSDGSKTTGGLLETQDLGAAVLLAKGRVPDSPISILGKGMGATVALRFMERTMGWTIVADSPYPTWQQALRCSNPPLWTRFAIPAVVDARLTQLFRGYQTNSDGNVVEMANPRHQMAHLMIVLGDRDNTVPSGTRARMQARLDSLYAEQLYIVSNAGRLQAAEIEPGEYSNRVIRFLKQSFDQPNL